MRPARVCSWPKSGGGLLRGDNTAASLSAWSRILRHGPQQRRQKLIDMDNNGLVRDFPRSPLQPRATRRGLSI